MADPQYTLLIVDDNEDNLDMLARRLRRKGYAVRCASSGAQALAQLQTEAADLVILDVMMPGMSGLEVVERIRKQPRLQSLPIIMATAKADSEDVVRALIKARHVVTTPRGGGVRISTHVYNTEEDVEQLLHAFDAVGVKPA